MINSRSISRRSTGATGELEVRFTFKGFLQDIDIDFGELEQDTLVTFETSNGRTWQYKGNNSMDFPFSPRHSINEARQIHLTGSPAPLERYVNSGQFIVRFEQAGANKILGSVEIIFET